MNFTSIAGNLRQLLSEGLLDLRRDYDPDRVHDLLPQGSVTLSKRRLERGAKGPAAFHAVAGVREVVSRAFAGLGKIDVIVNNAGYALFGAAEGLTDDQIVHQINTNLIGPIQVTRAALPYLRAQGGGHILAISTYGGQATYPGAFLYHASKWGLEGFFDSISGEVASFNIRVTIIEPGGVRTRFRETAGSHLGVMCQEVVYIDPCSGDGRKLVETGVGPVPVVLMGPGWKRCCPVF